MMKSREQEVAFITKYHCKRVETFEPPFELMEDETYTFYSHEYGECVISKSDGLFEVHSHIGCEWHNSKFFKTYQEAIDYARKLFLGEEDESKN